MKTVSQVQISNDKCEARRKEMELGLAILRNEFENKTSSMLELRSKLEEFTVIMPPTSKKLTGHIGFELCVRPSVRAFVRPFKNRAC